MPSAALPRITSSCAALLVASLPSFAEPIDTTAELEGVWNLPRKTAQFKVELEATASGAILAVSRVTRRCTYVLTPQGNAGAFESIPIKGNRCAPGVTRIQGSGRNLSLTLPTGWKDQTVTLAKANGPDTGARTYPTAAVRGVTLGMNFEQAMQVLRDDGLDVQSKGSSARVLQGVKGLTGTYAQASAPYGGEFGGNSASEEALGLFRVNGDVNAGLVAVLRHWAPAPFDAPRADAFMGALSNAYGPADDVQSSGRLQIHSWYYGVNGQRAVGAELTACSQRPGRDLRVAAILFDALEFISSTGRARLDGSSVRSDLFPQSGCGYTLRYHIRSNEDASLKNIDSVFYDHRAVANQIWTKDSAPLDDKIKRALQSTSAAQTNESKL